MNEASRRVAADAKTRTHEALEKLASYLRHPAISCQSEHHPDVRALAQNIREDLAKLGAKNARLLELPDALPIVAADFIADPALPTLLVYGHLDLQPVRGENWSSPPHELTRRGDRVFARGAADDMGGWVSHLFAIERWLALEARLPCNVRMLIESEEEIGSPNLERFMNAYPDAFEADVMVLTDCENPSPDTPGLTVSLRGLLELEVTCQALASDVHSGLWGNLVPDPALALMKLVSRLTDEDGRLSLGRMEVPDDWRARASDVPLDSEVIRRGARLIESVEPLPLRGRTPAEWVWRQPALTVLSTSLPSLGAEKNAIRARASCVLSLRVAPGQDADTLEALVRDALLREPPGGIAVRVERRGTPGMSWLYEPKGPAFEAADRAYRAAFGKPPLSIGVGGSIPFVALFARKYGTLPLILNGVMDPETGAHGPDESMHVGVFEKAIAANIHLYAELGALSDLTQR